jgi:hypothetical protein
VIQKATTSARQRTTAPANAAVIRPAGRSRCTRRRSLRLYDRIIAHLTGSQTSVEPIDQAMALIELLAVEVGARRPTSRGERLSAELMRDELASRSWAIRALPGPSA